MKDILRKIPGGSLLKLKTNSALKTYGWLNSFKKGLPVDSRNRPLPWLTYPCIDFLNSRLPYWGIVFLWGNGNGTKWFAERVALVFVVEHDSKWIADCTDNVSLYFEPNIENYLRVLDKIKIKYDLILIDGIGGLRKRQFEISKEYLTDDGVIIFDDTESPRHQNLDCDGYKRLDFWGMRPVQAYYSCTSIFYKKNNCLGI